MAKAMKLEKLMLDAKNARDAHIDERLRSNTMIWIWPSAGNAQLVLLGWLEVLHL